MLLIGTNRILGRVTASQIAMSGRAALDADQARCERREERDDLTSPEALAAGHLAQAVNCVDMEYVFRNV